MMTTTYGEALYVVLYYVNRRPSSEPTTSPAIGCRHTYGSATEAIMG
jgi:hypothetical protein